MNSKIAFFTSLLTLASGSLFHREASSRVSGLCIRYPFREDGRLRAPSAPRILARWHSRSALPFAGAKKLQIARCECASRLDGLNVHFLITQATLRVQQILTQRTLSANGKLQHHVQILAVLEGCGHAHDKWMVHAFQDLLLGQH